MKKSKAAAVYARTLLEAAAAGRSPAGGSASAEVSADLKALDETFRKLPSLARFLANPIRGSEEKAALLAPATEKLSPLTKRFLKLLEIKNRLALLPAIAEEYGIQEERKRNIERATVISAAALGAEQLQKLTRALESKRPGKTFILTNRIDPSLIAGFRIVEGDTITDASIKNKLELLRQKLAA
jgi:F-type H+-transporting ATPase subunit delta